MPDNIRNTDDKNAGFTEEDLEKLKENKKPSDTLKRGVGSGSDMNLLFAALVNAAGYEARVVLLPDRGRRFLIATCIVPGALHPTSIAVRSGETWKFFDLGPKYVTPPMLRWQEEGVDGMIADSSPEVVQDADVTTRQIERETHRNVDSHENGTLEGDVTIEYTGHSAVERKKLKRRRFTSSA